MLHTIDNAHDSYIRDIGWSFDMSKPYSLLATCSEDKTFKIWEVDLEKKTQQSQKVNKGNIVYKIAWNFMGNLLAVSFNNDQNVGCVQTYKQDRHGTWVNEACLS